MRPGPLVKPSGNGRDGSAEILAFARGQWPGRLNGGGYGPRPGRGRPSFVGCHRPGADDTRFGCDPELLPAPRHPNARRIESLLARTWPAGYDAVAKLVDVVWLLDTAQREPGQRGSVSAHVSPAQGFDGLGIRMTVFDVIGGVEAVLHETGHLRLRCLGMQVETHDGRIIANRPEELYVSALRKDKKRPMSACLHALYSYLMVTEFDVRLAESGDVEAYRYLGWNVPRLEFGLAEIRPNAVAAERGPLAGWLPAMLDWCQDVIERGGSLLRRERRRLGAPAAFPPHASTFHRPRS